MTQLIDRRLNTGKKSTVNRQRFIRRYKQQIKKAVLDAALKRNIQDMDKGESVTIPKRDLSEPRFRFGAGGVTDKVLPGNQDFLKGDKIPKPSAGESGEESTATKDGAGEDAFVFHVSREEFLDLYFEDLALPDLVRKELGSMEAVKNVRAGIVSSGMPVNINIVRSMRQAASRRMALRAANQRKLKQAEADYESTKRKSSKASVTLLKQIEGFKKKIKAVPFIDTLDLRYNYRTKVFVPATQAVMFCLMDVSGSMDEMKKEMAKQFFILLYLFLTKHYEHIEIVFIRHHTSAKVVDEQEFFYSRETGGTVVSSALELMVETMQARFSPDAWNIYVAQASDGDNWNADSPHCQSLLIEKIMPYVQYFAYVEIMPRHHQSLWEAYEAVSALFPQFAMQYIERVEQIYPVFRELFSRKTA